MIFSRWYDGATDRDHCATTPGNKGSSGELRRLPIKCASAGTILSIPFSSIKHSDIFYNLSINSNSNNIILHFFILSRLPVYHARNSDGGAGRSTGNLTSLSTGYHFAGTMLFF
jgi:hypothetical protein